MWRNSNVFSSLFSPFSQRTWSFNSSRYCYKYCCIEVTTWDDTQRCRYNYALHFDTKGLKPFAVALKHTEKSIFMGKELRESAARGWTRHCARRVESSDSSPISLHFSVVSRHLEDLAHPLSWIPRSNMFSWMNISWWLAKHHIWTTLPKMLSAHKWSIKW